MTEQSRQEQDGILRRQREAEHAAQAARLGQSAGQHQVVVPASSVQYPAIAGPASSGPITGYLQMPLESPTRCVTLVGARSCACLVGT
jgi:STAM-binding protein